jgi:RNA polymerase-associated protein RTF1
MGSVAMDESDSEASDNEDTGKRASIGETAFEREKRLAEQAEREEERQKTAKLKALIGERDRTRTDPSKPMKRKADLDEDDYDRRSSRPRTKKDQDTGRRAVRRRGLSDSPPLDSFADEKQAKRNDGKQPGTLPEYERVRMGRSRFSNVCFTPGFEDTFTGAFARVCSSVDPMTGQNTYRMCQIKGEFTMYMMAIPI